MTAMAGVLFVVAKAATIWFSEISFWLAFTALVGSAASSCSIRLSGRPHTPPLAFCWSKASLIPLLSHLPSTALVPDSAPTQPIGIGFPPLVVLPPAAPLSPVAGAVVPHAASTSDRTATTRYLCPSLTDIRDIGGSPSTARQAGVASEP